MSTEVHHTHASAMPAEYHAALARIQVANAPLTEHRCPVTGLTAQEKLDAAQAHAQAHGVDLVAAMIALGYAK